MTNASCYEWIAFVASSDNIGKLFDCGIGTRCGYGTKEKVEEEGDEDETIHVG